LNEISTASSNSKTPSLQKLNNNEETTTPSDIEEPKKRAEKKDGCHDVRANLQQDGNYEEAQKSIEKAIRIATATSSCKQTDIELAKMHEFLGDISFKLGQFEKSKSCYKSAGDIFYCNQSGNEKDLARTLLKRGDLEVSMGNPGNANIYYSVSLKTWTKLLNEEQEKSKKEDETGNDEARHCHLLYNTGMLHVKQGNYKEAEELFLELVSIGEKDTRNEKGLTTLAINANNSMGNIKYKKRMYEDAATYYTTAMELRKAIASKDEDGNVEDPSCREELVGLYTNLGRSFFQMKLLDESMKCFHKANRILMLEPQKCERSIASNWTQMGKVRCKQGQYRDARELYSDALKLEKKAASSSDVDNRTILLLRHNIAMTYCKEGQYMKGLEIMEHLLEREKKANGRSSLYAAKIYLDMCTIHLNLGNKRKMLSLLKTSSHILDERKIPENHPFMRERKSLQMKAEGVKKDMKFVSPLATKSYMRQKKTSLFCGF